MGGGAEALPAGGWRGGARPAAGGRGGGRGFGGPGTAESLAEKNADVLNRGYAIVMYNSGDCAEDTTLRELDGSFSFRHTRFYPAYPGYDWGILAGWAWGSSRIEDYLETDPTINSKVVLITGASRAGKSSMVAAAFDDRLIGAPVVTAGGGVAVYRASGVGRGGREGLGEMVNKYPNWFGPQLRQFWTHTDQLPFDNHWFLALCAPRPFISCEGDTDTNSLPLGVKASIKAAWPVYEFLGVRDNLGVNYAPHAHAFTADDWTAMMDFTDKVVFHKPIERTFNTFLPDTPDWTPTMFDK